MENGSGRGGAFGALRRDRTLQGVLLLALLLRLLYAFLLFPAIGEKLHWKGVDDGYDEIARHWIHGHGYVDRPGDAPNLVKPPGYVFFLAGLYTLFGEEVNEGVRVRVAQSLIDTGTVFLVFLLGVRVFGDRRVGILGALLWAVYPQMIVYGARVAPESLFVFLLTALMLLLIRLRAEGRLRDALSVGVLFGLAVLVKEKLIFFPPLLLLLVLFAPALPGRRRVALALLLAAAALAVTTPWLVRGYRVAGTFVPVTLRSGRALNQGMNESFAGADETLVDFFRDRPDRRWRDLPESERERLERARNNARDEVSLVGKAWARIAGDPASFLRSFVVKLGTFWYFGQPRVIAGNMAVQFPLLGLGIAAYLRERRRRDLAPFALLVAYFLVVHALTIVRMRYSLPVMPEVILLAAASLLVARERFRA